MFPKKILLPNQKWISYLVTRDVVNNSKSLSCLFPRDLTIIHTMNQVTPEALLFSQCEDVMFLLAPLLTSRDCCEKPATANVSGPG